MAEFYANGNKLATDKDIEQINDKVNIKDCLFKDCSTDTDVMNEFNIPVGSNLGLLKVLRLNHLSGNKFNSYNGIGLLFGKDGETALLSTVPTLDNKNVHIAVSLDNGKSIAWADDFVLKSEYKQLQNRVATLENKIGGGATQG